MNPSASPATVREPMELPAAAYPGYQHIFKSDDDTLTTGLLFDSPFYAIMSITHLPDSQMPDLNVDKEGDRVLILLEGDLTLQIGADRFRLAPGDAVQIPKGLHFGKSNSQAGAQMLLVRTKPLRSFAMHR